MRLAALMLALLLGACTTAQVASSARSACRADPQRCTDRDAMPATRTPGL